jgi:Putative zinc-finger
MIFKDSHISDRDLLMTADGELSRWRTARIRKHLAACRACRTRMDEIEGTISEFIHLYRSELDDQLPPAGASRARLEAELRSMAQDTHAATPWRGLAYAACAVAFVMMCMLILRTVGVPGFFQTSEEATLLPNPSLTPGATRAVTTAELCAPESSKKPRFISASTGQTVFDEYGIGDPRPRSYELDYLIDPELGGSDDVKNLWPQPYSAKWNARVKDALEEHLHEMVCAGQLSLPTAQQDISKDWIGTYKKYFHTDTPVVGHLAFIKDEPWKN